MLTFKNRKNRKFKGSGIMDSLISAVTSDTMKKVGEEVSKKAMTEIGNRAAEKVVDKIIPKNKHKLDKHLSDDYSFYEKYKKGEVIDIKDLIRKNK